MTDPMGLDDTAPTYSPRQTSQWKADEEYGQAMAKAQWARTTTNLLGSTIEAGMAGYNAWSARGGLTMGLNTKAVSIEGTNPNLAIPNTLYDTGSQAAKAGVDPAYDIANETRDREMTGPVGQVNGFSSGHFFPGPFERGMGKILKGSHAGDQGSYIDRLTQSLPQGSHLAGYYTVHIHYDPVRIQHTDSPIFQGYWGIPAHILMKSPGYNGNWEKPMYYSYPSQW
jgi:hypothetical protein